VSGRRIFRVGRPEPFEVHFGNRGLTDFPGGFLFISGLPADALVEVGPAFQPPRLPDGVVLPQSPLVRTEFGTGLMPVEVPRLAPGESGSVTFRITLPQSEGFSFDRHTLLFPDAALAAGGLQSPARPARDLRGSPHLAGTPVADRAGLTEAMDVASDEYATGYLPVRHAWGQSSVGAAVHLQHQLINRAQSLGSALRGWTVCPIGRGTEQPHVALALTSAGGRAYLLDNYFYPAALPLTAAESNQWRVDSDWLLDPANAASLWGRIERGFLAGNADAWGIAGPVHSLGGPPHAALTGRRGARLMAGAVAILNDDLFGDPTGAPSGSWLANSAVNLDLYIYLFNEQRPYHPGQKPPYESVGSGDPNLKFGPLGVGSPGWLAAGQDLHYTIFFENIASASAPAQLVTVVDPVDPALDPATVELEGVAFNNTEVSLPRGRQHFASTIPVATDPNPVRVTADFDAAASQLTWTMQSVDLVTGGLPEDPFAGFLPPNRADDAGLGHVSFRARLREGLPHGTTFTNLARIVFDVNTPILTPACVNTLDLRPPTSTIAALPADSGPEFRLDWSGTDDGAGIVAYRIYVAQDRGPYLLWLQSTNTTARFLGEPRSRYAFYSVALDGAGHSEVPPTVPDAVTVISILPPTIVATWREDGLELRWNASAGVPYHVEAVSTLDAQAGWQSVARIVATSAGVSWKDSEIQALRFYRVRLGD